MSAAQYPLMRPLACAGLFAIEILAQCPGGGWRTLSEWQEIFGSQGYQLEDSKGVGASMNLLVFARKPQ